MTDRIDTAKEREKLAALEGHTPGPWDASGLTVYDTCMDGVASCHADADARLIAAAPDLRDRYAAALDEIERLREALAPFAGAAESAIGVVGKTTTLGVLGATAVYFVAWRDFTRARAALNPEGEA